MIYIVHDSDYNVTIRMVRETDSGETVLANLMVIEDLGSDSLRVVVERVEDDPTVIFTVV